MQILTVSPDLYGRYQNPLTQMFRLRAAIFGRRLEWDVSIRGKEERDQYDDLNPTYILAMVEQGLVAGCARLLPVAGPTMLECTFPQLLAEGRLAAHAGMVESSRFCVDTTLPGGTGGGLLHLATLTMFAGIIEWSMENRYDEIVTATDLRFERILSRAGWPMKRLGDSMTIGNTVAVAGTLPADRKSFERVCPQGYRSIAVEHQGRQIRSAV